MADTVARTICIGKPERAENWVGRPWTKRTGKASVKHRVPFGGESPVRVIHNRRGHWRSSGDSAANFRGCTGVYPSADYHIRAGRGEMEEKDERRRLAVAHG